MSAPVCKWLSAVLLVAAGLGCGRDEPAVRREPEAAPKKALPVETMAAPEGGEVQEIVRQEVSRAKGDGRRLLVYVGAKWCEPCRRFHEAAKAGQLDGAFPGLRLLEFDLDRDRDRLIKAGYQSRMIPLFALPRSDGTGSGDQIEGSIKGPGAVDQITPRLRALLAKGDSRHSGSPSPGLRNVLQYRERQRAGLRQPRHRDPAPSRSRY